LKSEAKKILREVALYLCGMALGFLYVFGLGSTVAGMSLGAGHGDYSAVRVLNIPFGYGIGIFPFVFGLCFIAKSRIAAAIGVAALVGYFLALWIGDAAGTLRYFRSPFAFVVLPLLYAHLFFCCNMLLYFIVALFRIGPSRLNSGTKKVISAVPG
jgi:hypothetical protein